jgi:hypothetical protein
MTPEDSERYEEIGHEAALEEFDATTGFQPPTLKRAFILIEVTDVNEEGLEAKVGAIRKPLAIPSLSHMPFYEDHGPALKDIGFPGLEGSVSNRWQDFAWIFDNLPWRS